MTVRLDPRSTATAVAEHFLVMMEIDFVGSRNPTLTSASSIDIGEPERECRSIGWF